MIIPIKGLRPHSPLFLAPGAFLIGDVRVGKDVSIWYGAVVRADINYIEIGDRTNIQDLCVLHVTEELPVVIGPDVTIGHRVVVHGACIEPACLVGMGAVILDGARIGEGSIVAAGSVVREGVEFPPRSLIAGVPATVKRTVSDEEYCAIVASARHYVNYAREYLESTGRTDETV